MKEKIGSSFSKFAHDEFPWVIASNSPSEFVIELLKHYLSAERASKDLGISNYVLITLNTGRSPSRQNVIVYAPVVLIAAFNDHMSYMKCNIYPSYFVDQSA